MRVEIDQSGKIERTSQDTVVAFSNDEALAILIPAKVKREVIAAIKTTRKVRRPYLLLFAASLYELVRSHLHKLEHIIIDVEYPNREASIKLQLLSFIWQHDPGYPPDRISFAHIGKKSAAHRKALATFRGEITKSRPIGS